MSNEQRSHEYRAYIEEYLKGFYQQFHNEPQRPLFDAVEYSLLAGGKRLRPIFAFDFCRMCGADWKKAAPFGAAVEMIHTYSLIHDDLPAMDNDEYRRGKKTTWVVYGEDMAILAGDGLLNYAFETALKAFGKADAMKVAECLKVLAGKAGIFGMIGGQVVDVMSEE